MSVCVCVCVGGGVLQNIDTLERQAGISEDLLVEAHGAFHNAHCIDCGAEYSHEFVRGKEIGGGWGLYV